MITTIYLVRHAEANHHEHDDLTRSLTHKGMQDRELVTNYLSSRTIDYIYSSPYKRAIETIEPLSKSVNLAIILEPEFRERKISSDWIDNFDAFARKQWQDFHFKLDDGESLDEVQIRNIKGLNHIIEKHDGKTIVVASHGTALSTILNYYDASFNYESFQKIKNVMPWIVVLTFNDKKFMTYKEINLFN